MGFEFVKNQSVLVRNSCHFVGFPGKRIQEGVSILLCTTMFVLNGVVLIGKAEIGHLPTILVAAFFGILTADFLSGLVFY